MRGVGRGVREVTENMVYRLHSEVRRSPAHCKRCGRSDWALQEGTGAKRRSVLTPLIGNVLIAFSDASRTVEKVGESLL